MQSYTDDAQPTGKWLKAALYGVALWSTFVVIAVLGALGHIRAMAPGHGAHIALGPLKFLYVHKDALKGGGYTLTISLHFGLLILLAICIAAEIFVTWLGHRQPAQNRSPDA